MWDIIKEMTPEGFTPQEALKPQIFYHATENRGIAEVEPRKINSRDKNEGEVVFATPSKVMATEFIVRTDGSWANGGRFGGKPYFVISDRERFEASDQGGAIYHLPSETFENNPSIGLGRGEWTSKVAVRPIDKDVYESGLQAMLEAGVQVYFVDKATYQEIKSATDHGYSLLKSLESENQKLGINPISFE